MGSSNGPRIGRIHPLIGISGWASTARRVRILRAAKGRWGGEWCAECAPYDCLTSRQRIGKPESPSGRVQTACRWSRQVACNASRRDALAGHLYQWCCNSAPHVVVGVGDDTAYRERLARANAEFALVCDIAKAPKHIQLNRGSPQVSTVAQVETRSLGWGEARWGEGRWDSPPRVVVQTDAGEFRVVEAILDRALSFLEAEMKRLRIPYRIGWLLRTHHSVWKRP
jgi:hypothetical protein